MDKFKVEFYESVNGVVPVEEFLLSIDIKMRAKLIGIMDLLEDYGNQLREPYSKPLGDGIFEIRGKIGTDISRVLYFFYYEKRIIFTNGFIKKTDKAPPNEILKAKSYRDDFLRRERER